MASEETPGLPAFDGSSMAIAVTAAIAFSIVLWDYFSLLPQEIKVYQLSRRADWYDPATPAFIFLRYSAFIATFSPLFLTSIPTSHCASVVTLTQTGILFVTAASGVIFASRVIAIWGVDRRRMIQIFVYGTLVVLLTCWIAVLSQYHGTQGPPNLSGGYCHIEPHIVLWAPIAYTSSTIFSGLILLLALLKFHDNRRPTSSHIASAIYRNCIVYFIISLVANLTAIVIQLATDSSSGNSNIQFATLPLSTLITIAMGQRVFFNLRLHNTYQGRHESRTNSSNSDLRLPFPAINRIPVPKMHSTSPTSVEDAASQADAPAWASLPPLTPNDTPVSASSFSSSRTARTGVSADANPYASSVVSPSWSPVVFAPNRGSNQTIPGISAQLMTPRSLPNDPLGGLRSGWMGN